MRLTLLLAPLTTLGRELRCLSPAHLDGGHPRVVRECNQRPVILCRSQASLQGPPRYRLTQIVGKSQVGLWLPFSSLPQACQQNKTRAARTSSNMAFGRSDL